VKWVSASLVGLAVLGCARTFVSGATPGADDGSVVFPQFFEQDAVQVGTQGRLFMLEGAVLQALTVAANDFLPPEGENSPCARRRSAHRFRIISREDVIFIRIDEDPTACGQTRPGGLDSGARYAISRDGRILRRVFDGMEPYIPSADAGIPEQAEPGTSPSFEPSDTPPLPFLGRDPDAGSPPDAQAP
jgi:hypothetical protein